MWASFYTAIDTLYGLTNWGHNLNKISMVVITEVARVPLLELNTKTGFLEKSAERRIGKECQVLEKIQ
jgi:hypothetical protein